MGAPSTRNRGERTTTVTARSAARPPPPRPPPVNQSLRTALLVVLLVVYAVTGLRPAAQAVWSSSNARDYATYHYAVQEAVAGGDPYDTAALGRRAAAEGTRRGVHPFFYPPPFVLGAAWVAPLDLATGYRAWFVVQQISVLGILAVLWRWLGASPLLLAGVLATFSPIPDNLKMGQANLPVLLLAVVALWRGWGAVMGAAGMAKMSPALYLVGWAAKRRWRPAVVAALTAVGLSIATLPLVRFEHQMRFFTEILPGFSTGEYHGLRVPITLPANHSIPDLFNQLWPGQDKHHLSATAATASKIVSLGLLAALVPVFHRSRGALGEAGAFGALTVLLTITPVYAYEHHLAFLLLPVVVVGAALERGALPRWTAALAVPAYAFTAIPLYWLRGIQKVAPPLHWALQESKFVGPVLLAGLCVAVAWASDRDAAAATARPR